MNLKGLTAPLTEKIESLMELVQKMVDDIDELKQLNQKQFIELQKVNENLSDLVDAQKNICKPTKDNPSNTCDCHNH